jgi:formiminoglutamase
MASIAPKVSPDGNKSKRPMFCISNQDGKTSTSKMIELLSMCISESFEINRKEISLNDPFHGGYITKTYGNNPIPWIQVEMNRDLYLAKSWFDEETLSFDSSRLRDLNKQFENCMNAFFSRI